MKIAFVDHVSVSGGIIRYATRLAKAIAQIEKDNEVTYFTHQKNYLGNKKVFDDCQPDVDVQVLEYTKSSRLSNKYFDIAINKLLRSSWYEKLRQEIIKKTREFDVVYFTCAHASDYINVYPAAFATFHDMNWKYLFGSPLWSKPVVENLHVQLEKWFSTTTVIVSSPFVKSEILKFWPDITNHIHVVFLPNPALKILDGSKTEILERLGLNKPYILFPGHLMPHKNHNNLFYAFWKLMNDADFKDKYILALSGWSTDHFEYGLATSTGLQMADKTNYNVRGLGYLSNEEVDVVIKNAAMGISPSLHEAGSGPALDAWINEVPFILSDIQPHLDQLNFFNIDCVTFNPMDTNDIYEKMKYSLYNLPLLKEYSQKAASVLENYTWETVARLYLDIFKSKSL